MLGHAGAREILVKISCRDLALGCRTPHGDLIVDLDIAVEKHARCFGTSSDPQEKETPRAGMRLSFQSAGLSAHDADQSMG